MLIHLELCTHNYLPKFGVLSLSIAPILMYGDDFSSFETIYPYYLCDWN